MTDNIERRIANRQIKVDSKQKDLDYTKSISGIIIKMYEDEAEVLYSITNGQKDSCHK
ncbi:MAG TPA: hypothetical protein PK604_11775 [Acetivibrio clariflavus]|uniref:hypothetical protein n=1 Tax=Acetivibrio clariflavus TaxID=288965 RepID=UPI0004B7AC7E|nr:hypothetical protein [Acetivibrio clariflavus]